MPYSDSAFDNTIKKFLLSQDFNEVVDIGAGAGKYGVLIRNISPKANITAIEVDASYIKEFDLKSIYDKVYISNVETFFNNKPDFTTDIVVIGDCLEHLRKSAGIDLINYLVYRSKNIICVFPSRYVQYSWNKHASEAHISVWGKPDFDLFETVYRKKGFMNLAIIKGYR